jgi:hypothetical protein
MSFFMLDFLLPSILQHFAYSDHGDCECCCRSEERIQYEPGAAESFNTASITGGPPSKFVNLLQSTSGDSGALTRP